MKPERWMILSLVSLISIAITIQFSNPRIVEQPAITLDLWALLLFGNLALIVFFRQDTNNFEAF